MESMMEEACPDPRRPEPGKGATHGAYRDVDAQNAAKQMARSQPVRWYSSISSSAHNSEAKIDF
jgi:hypothetical protein